MITAVNFPTSAVEKKKPEIKLKKTELQRDSTLKP